MQAIFLTFVITASKNSKNLLVKASKSLWNHDNDVSIAISLSSNVSIEFLRNKKQLRYHDSVLIL